MIAWLIDTLVMTGLLMGLVLLVRRPAARLFGAQAAYALWALPMARLVLPPLALPAAMAPTHWLSRLDLGFEETTARAGEAAANAPLDAALAVSGPSAVPVLGGGAVAPGASLSGGALPGADLFSALSWQSGLIALWLAGAALFLAWRVYNYQMMRRQLLADARPVAHAGQGKRAVRIVESPLAGTPIAFGVFDKVVALPFGFLASADSESSDFAIAHELEHHAGGDLLAIMAMQPLFALHWFNPLGWSAWNAMRGDQEAACDARVMAGRDRAERARYGALIASFAGGRQLTLGAPMAGGLSGDKPIIQRLKALRQGEISVWRKLVGRSLFALCVVCVPTTATVSYAAFEPDDGEPMVVPPVPNAPTPPEAPQAPAAPIAPIAPAAPGAPVAPRAPVPPVPPVPPSLRVQGDRAKAEEQRASAERQRARAEGQRARAEAERARDEAERARAEAVRAR
ncbi:M56 family metallopeptidase, partial [Novosphingobium sp. 1949]